MDELNNAPERENEQPLVDRETKPVSVSRYSKKTIKNVFLLLLIIGAIYFFYSIAYVLFSPDRNIRQIYLIPEDAAFIIETSDPVNDWKKFSNGETWQCLKQAKSIADITATVAAFDSVVQNNKTLLSLVGKRDMLISLHKTRPTDWDFLAVVDVRKASKLETLKSQIETVLKLAGSEVTQRTYSGVIVHEMRDTDTRDILYMAFVDNHVVLTYRAQLLHAAIDGRKSPKIGINHAFIEAEKLVAGKGLVRVYINYANLPKFMSIYTDKPNEYLDMFSRSMEFAGLFLHTDKEKIEIKGYTMRKDTANPYVTALLNSGKHKMRAHEIMSGRTALYTNIGFDDPATFVEELENTLSANDKAMFESYKNTRSKLEDLFDISLSEHFLSWMSGEFALSQSEPGLLGYEPELILAVRAKSIKDAHEKMDFIEKKIKKRTPVKVKTTDYKSFEIKYVEMKGFFRLFFGGMFDKFEKPYYTYIDDYVVFSNKSSSLLSFIEDYEQKNLLKNNPGFKNAYSYFHSNSTAFVYTDIHKFYPQLRSMVNPATWKDLQANRDVVYAFPYWTMQIVGGRDKVSLHYIMDYKPYTEESVEEPTDEEIDKQDKAMSEDAESERELMSELKRFYVEKFEGNVLREFYSDGTLKSESEVKNGKRHGRYREYYEDGTLKLRGKYTSNQPKGTWKYYTAEGKFERKEKF